MDCQSGKNYCAHFGKIINTLLWLSESSNSFRICCQIIFKFKWWTVMKASNVFTCCEKRSWGTLCIITMLRVKLNQRHSTIQQILGKFCGLLVIDNNTEDVTWPQVYSLRHSFSIRKYSGHLPSGQSSETSWRSAPSN